MWQLLLIDKKFYGEKLAGIFCEAIRAQGYENASLVILDEGGDSQHYVVSLARYENRADAADAAQLAEIELGEAFALYTE